MKILVFVLVSLSLVACTSTSETPKKMPETMPEKSTEAQPSSATAADYCQSVGGHIRSVQASKDDFCVLPGGEVVKLQAFYNNNH